MIRLALLVLALLYLDKHVIRVSKTRGKQGEKLVSKTLKRHKLDILINNIIIKEGNKYAQIDHILITKNLVYIIETKNHSGLIIGEKGNLKWTAIYGKTKYSIYNPVRQNEVHIKRLKAIIGDYPMKSIVIFSNSKCNLKTDISGVYTLKEFNKDSKKIYSKSKVHIPKYSILLKIMRHNLKYNPIHRLRQLKYAKQMKSK